MKKRIIAAVLAIGLVVTMLVAFTGCQTATSSSMMTITSLEGAGTRTFTFQIAADKEAVANDPDENGVVTYQTFNNSTYFPLGYQAMCDYIEEKLGSDYTVTVDESAVDYVYINLTYSFTNIEDYVAKTKALVTEERWTKSKFADPKIYVERLDETYFETEEAESVVSEATEDTASDATEDTASVAEEAEEEEVERRSLDTDAGNEGKIRYTFVESKFIASAVCIRLCELVATQEAVDAGVFAPYGDSKKNKYCVEEDFDLWNLAFPSNILDTSCTRSYKFMDYEYEETKGLDGIIAWYVDDNGQELTEPLPAGTLSLGSKPGWTISDYLEYQNDEETDYYTNLSSDVPVGLIIGIIAAVVVVGVVVVVVIAVVKKKQDDDDEYEDDDDEDDEDEEDEE